MKDSRLKGIIFASITTFFWGFLAIALKLASNIMDPLTIAWFRFFVAASVLVVFYAIKKPSYFAIFRNPPLYLLVASLGLGINYLAFVYGVRYVPASSANVIIQMGPILLGLMGIVVFKEKISLRQAFGFLIAGIGLFIFYRDNLKLMAGGEDLFNMGVLMIIIAALAWVVYAAFQKTLVRTYPGPQLNLVIFSMPVLLFSPFVKYSAFPDLSLVEWGLMIYLGANTLIAYGSLALAFKYLEANKISIIITLNPIITFIIMGLLAYFEASWIVPDVLTTKGVFAALLVVSGAILAVSFARSEKRKEISGIFKKSTNS